MDVKFVSEDLVVIDGVSYKRLKTSNGRYSKDFRRIYMKKYREKQRNKFIINQ
jgi:hypothetical protein